MPILPTSPRVKRRNIVLALGTIAVALRIAKADAQPRATGTVFTADEIAGSVSAIDLATGQVRSVGLPIQPHNVQIAPDGKTLLLVGVAGHAAHGGASTGRLIVMDARDFTRPARANIAIGPHPAHVITDRAGARAFVTDSVHNGILPIDLASGTLGKWIPAGTYPHGLRLAPDGSELYVANMRSGDVSVINLAAQAEVARIRVGAAPVQVGFTPDGRSVGVSLNGENAVVLIDRASRTVVGRVAVGRNPVQVQASVDGSLLYVANQGTTAQPDDTVSLIDIDRRVVVATIPSGRGAHGVAISNDGRLVFISNIADASVAVLDTAQRRRVASFKVGTGPNGITYVAAP